MTENVVWELDLGGAQGRRDFVSAHYASNTCWKCCKTIVDNDVPLLIARVKTLETQAELTTAVVEAAVAHRLAEIAEDAVDWDLDTPEEEEEEAHQKFVTALSALAAAKQRLDAALAAYTEHTEE